MRKRIARALITLAHRIHHVDHVQGTHEPSDATRHGGYTVTDLEAMRAEIELNRYRSQSPRAEAFGPYQHPASFRLDPEAIAEQRTADIRAHAQRAIR